MEKAIYPSIVVSWRFANKASSVINKRGVLFKMVVKGGEINV
jgi:hypothetical protein